jgi:Inosine-uridine preferring nucleoside hydrolase
MRLSLLLALTVFSGLPLGAAEPVPIVYCTDLYHPHIDADDHIDLATVFALPELDLKAILLDDGALQEKRPGRVPVEQMLRLSGRRVSVAIGLTALKSPADTGRGQPAAHQAAVGLLLKILRGSARPVTIITAGSVRDVAAAFNREPELLRAKVAGLYLNIGNSAIGGDEYNVAIDRHAYRRLIGSGLPILWFPCFPTTGRMTTYFRFTRFPDALRGAPVGLRNYFLYAIRQLDPMAHDPQVALAAHLGSVAEALAHAPSFQGGKEMWCTPSLLSAAGRRCYRVGGRFVAAKLPPAGASEVPAYEFLPARLEIDEQGKPTRVELGVRGTNLRVFHLTDPGSYAQVMNDCLFDLFEHFPLGKDR